MTRENLCAFICTSYASDEEHPWADSPEYSVFRHKGNRKWFALMMTIPKDRLIPDSKGMCEVMNIKADPVMAGSVYDGKYFFPAYHMNKEHWMSIILDGNCTAEVDEKIKFLLDLSFGLTKPKAKRKKQ